MLIIPVVGLLTLNRRGAIAALVIICYQVKDVDPGPENESFAA